MAHQLNFEKLLDYDIGDAGVSLDVNLTINSQTVVVKTKIDTGSSYCIFDRATGEALGIDIKSGTPERIGTVVGSFLVYGHSLTLNTAGFEFDSFVFFAADESFKRNVPGRFGWLDRVIIGLVDYEGKLYLSRYSE